jgi:hypothetical protein
VLVSGSTYQNQVCQATRDSSGNLSLTFATPWSGVVSVGAGGGAASYTGTFSSFPTTCGTNGLYYGFATDASPGLNQYFCTTAGSPGTWTQQAAVNTVGGNQTASTYSTNGTNSGADCLTAKTSLSVACLSVPDTLASGGTLNFPALGGGTYTVPTDGLDISCTSVPCSVQGVNGAAVPTNAPILATNSSGQLVNAVLSSNVPNVSASQSTVTLYGMPGASNYSIHYDADLVTPCTTGSSSIALTFNWTDLGAARSYTTPTLVVGNTQTPFSFLSNVVPFRVNSGSIAYTSTVVQCTTGTAVYEVHVGEAAN